jgi:hypothetical protein
MRQVRQRQRSLPQLEAVVDRGLATFFEVGHALQEIRVRRLYQRAGYATFAEYAEKRFGLGRTHAYRQIDAALVVDALSPFGDTLPANEAQARALKPLLVEPPRLARVWQQALAENDGVPPPSSVIAERVRAERKHGEQQLAWTRPRPPMTAPSLDETAETWCDDERFMRDVAERLAADAAVELRCGQPEGELAERMRRRLRAHPSAFDAVLFRLRRAVEETPEELSAEERYELVVRAAAIALGADQRPGDEEARAVEALLITVRRHFAPAAGEPPLNTPRPG